MNPGRSLNSAPASCVSPPRPASAPPTAIAESSSMPTLRPERRAASALPPTTRRRKPHEVERKITAMIAAAPSAMNKPVCTRPQPINDNRSLTGNARVVGWPVPLGSFHWS